MRISLPRVLNGLALAVLAFSAACLDSNMDSGGSGGGGTTPGGGTTAPVFADPNPTPGNLPTPGAAGGVTAAITCGADSLAGIPETGSIGLPYASGDVIALCDGWVLIADQTNERIELRNIVTGVVDSRWDVPGAPDDLELDTVNEFIYATLPDQNLIAAIDMNGAAGAPPNIAAVNSSPSSITQSDNHILVAADGGSELRAYEKPTLGFVGLDADLDGASIIFNAEPFPPPPAAPIPGFNLISVSATKIVLYDYDEARPTPDDLLIPVPDAEDPSNGASLDLDLSPDGLRVAFVNSAGNQSTAGPNVINDFFARDADSTFGAWKIEANPTSAAFNPLPAEDYFLATTATEMVIMDISRHAEISRTTPASACAGSFEESEFSAGGAIALAKMDCTGTGSEIHWQAPAAGFGDSLSTIGAPFAALSTILPAVDGDPLCATDDVDSVTAAAQGQVTVPLGADFEPLCDGWAFMTERSANRVVLKNLITNVTLAEWDLRDLPVEMVIDEANQFLFVAMGAGGGLARIDLAGPGLGTLVQQAAPGFPHSIAIGAGGDVWTTGLFEPGEVRAVRTSGLTMVDGGPFVGESYETPTEITFDTNTAQIGFDRLNGALFLADTGGFARFIPNGGTQMLDVFDPDDELFDDLPSEIMATSPDGFSIAFVDQNADLVFDFETGVIADFTDTFWEVDSLLDMTGLAFNGTGERLGVSTTDELIVFDAGFRVAPPPNPSHDELGTFEPVGCNADVDSRPGVSRGNAIGFFKSDCGIAPTSTPTETIYWWEL